MRQSVFVYMYIHMTFFFLILGLHQSSSSDSDSSLSPDSKRLYHDIVSGHGLYNGFKMITELGGNNFKSIVFGNETDKLWLVEFYNSWCGHCHRFAPTWKAFASNVYDWRGVVKIGSVDCANDANFDICQRLGTTQINSRKVKLFFPGSKDENQGRTITRTKVDKLINKVVIENLKKNHKNLENDKVFSILDANYLMNERISYKIWEDIPFNIKFIVLVLENHNDNSGFKLALDLSWSTEVQVRLVGPKNRGLRKDLNFVGDQKGVVVIDRNFNIENLHVKKMSSENLYKAVQGFLEKHGFIYPIDPPSPNVFPNLQIGIGDIMVMRAEDKMKDSNVELHDSYTKVFQVDLEAALRGALTWEVPRHENIMQQQLGTLRDFTRVLMKYFPFKQNGKTFLEKLHNNVLSHKDWLTGKSFVTTFHSLQEELQPFLPVKGYFSCKGSQPKYRGYSCSLWTLWHTLSVHSELVNRGKKFTEPEVLLTITRYMRNFYNGFKCADNFYEMSKSMDGNVSSEDDSILWLWEAHNDVNHRLSHDPIAEDPNHVKTQFPTKSMCPPCHNYDGSWNKKEVLTFLKLMYSNIIYPNWRDVIRVGAVDCANDANNQLCRDLEVMYYPMIKLFPPNSDETALGETYDKGTVDEMRKAVVTKLITHQKSLDKVESRVNLKPLTHSNLDAQLWNDLPSDAMYLVLVSEPEDSTVGSEVVLDLSRAKEVIIRLLGPSNVHLSQLVGIEQGSNGAVLVERDLSLTKLQLVDFTRITLNKAVREFLISHGVEVSPDLPVSEVVIAPEVNIGDVMAIMQMEEEIKKQLQTKTLSTVAFQIDLEGAIRYSLKNEVPLHRNITGVQLNALKNYLAVLIKYFPIGQHGVEFLKHLNRVGIGEKEEIRGKEFRQTFLQLENEYKPFLAEQGWIGCRGSKPEFRGYPCSLWTLFHTLTVHEEIKDRHKPNEGPEVVDAMAGYIKNFFTCSDCAAHFTEMAKTIAGNVTTQNNSILWLWSAHNRVNMRLAGDATEDPEHKKVQFPSKEACPACHTTDGSWNQTEVLKFLKHMFSNIVYIQKNDLTTSTTTVAPSAKVEYDKNLRNEIYGEELGYTHKQVDKRTAWDFNVFDISLCVVLYVCSVAILILVCIKFVFKRSYRKKPYIHDILSKV